MTAINLIDQIVATAYDRKSRVCSYTYQHTDGSRYTVRIPIDDLAKIGAGMTGKARDEQRRKHLATRLLTHMQSNPPDGHVRPSDRAVAQSAARP